MSDATAIPAALLDRWREILPVESFESITAGSNEPPATSIRLNPLRGDPAATFTALTESGHALTRTTWCEHAATTLTSVRALQDHPAHGEGRFHIQSLSSIAVSLALDPQPEESTLDLCAAPGSKTSHIAALKGNRGVLVANDSSRPRFFRLKEVLRILGAHADCQCTPGERWQHAVAFDRVLVDAPCSAEGRALAGDPKAAADWSIHKVRRLASLQKSLLHAGLDALRVGGTLVYSTCTLAPEENELVVARALERYEGSIDLVPIECALPPSIPGLTHWREPIDSRLALTRRILPPLEGFFVAKFVRTGEARITPSSRR